MLVNPFQLAVMTARIATGKEIMPHLLLNDERKPAKLLHLDPEHLSYVHQAMRDVVNGPGTAGRAKLPVDNVELSGQTGTAQVVSLDFGRGGSDVAWKFRDHGLFVCYAPFDNPRYAASVVIEHGGGSGSAYPVARDVPTYLYDREKAMNMLTAMEKSWGGTISERMDRKLAAYRDKAELEKALSEGRAEAPTTADSEAASSAAGE